MLESEFTETEQRPKAPKEKPIAKNEDNKMDFVHFGNHNWNLVLHMLFGIRQSVVSVKNDDVFQLTDKEFTCKLRYELESIENQKSAVYEFYDFCPKVFHLIRKFFGINSDHYL